MLQRNYYRNYVASRQKVIQIYMITDLHMRKVDGDANAVGATGAHGLFYSVPSNVRNFRDIVNRQNPDYVISLGDSIHGDYPPPTSDPDGFMTIWNGITCPKALTIGNHDLDDQTYEELRTKFGYASAPLVGGSHFNQSIKISKGNVSVKILMVDSTFNGSNVHGPHWQNCRFHTDSLSWIATELSNATEKAVLICSHVGPQQHDYSTHFDPTQAQAIKTIVDQAVTAKPTLKVYGFSGHAHTENPTSRNSLGSNFPGWIFPSLIRKDGITPNGGVNGKYTVLSVFSDGSISMDMGGLRYPYV